MIHIEQAEATDLETIINIQRAISRLFMRNIMISMPLIWKIESGSSGSWWNVLIVFTILSKMTKKLLAFFACRPMMREQKVGLGQLRFYLSISEKAMVMKGFTCLRKHFRRLLSGIYVRFSKMSLWSNFMKNAAIIKRIRNQSKRAWTWFI